jgi:hypothetical protein
MYESGAQVKQYKPLALSSHNNTVRVSMVKQQEVLGRTNLPLSFDMAWTSYKMKQLGGTEDSLKFEIGSGALIYISTFIKICSGIQI